LEQEDRYVKARRIDFKAQRHNARIFLRSLSVRPWSALILSAAFTVLACMAFFNLIDSPQWHRRPWMAMLLGVIAFLVACIFFFFALRGFINRSKSDFRD
jgi:protein-S-isoprenylcysteine O-methyltransferase Ste14